MSVEAATYINQLNTAFPAATDLRAEGDDHIRLIKTTIKNSFPGTRDFRNITAPDAFGPIYYDPLTAQFGGSGTPRTQLVSSATSVTSTTAGGSAATFVAPVFSGAVEDFGTIFSGGGMNIGPNTNKGYHVLTFQRTSASFGVSASQFDYLLVRFKLGGTVQAIFVVALHWRYVSNNAGGATAKLGQATLVVPQGLGASYLNSNGLWTVEIAAVSDSGTGTENITVGWTYYYTP